MGSPRAKYLWSSLWQKYCERNSSCVQMICAPSFAARSAAASVFFRFASGCSEQLVCSSPRWTTFDVDFCMEQMGLFEGRSTALDKHRGALGFSDAAMIH